MSRNGNSAIPYEDIDCEIRRLVRLVNEFPGIRTWGSCAGHAEGEEAEIDFVAESQESASLLLSSMPFWEWSAGFVNNQPQYKTIWATVRSNGHGTLSYKLRLAGHPLHVQRVLLGEVESALSDALTRQAHS